MGINLMEALKKVTTEISIWANDKLDNKVDKVDGKDLSTNDYTTTEKNKLAGIAEGANKTIIDSELSGTSTNPLQNKVVNEAIFNAKIYANEVVTEWVGDTPVATQISNAIDEITALNLGIFPVNAVYITSTNSDPSSYLGGTWELLESTSNIFYWRRTE